MPKSPDSRIGPVFGELRVWAKLSSTMQPSPNFHQRSGRESAVSSTISSRQNVHQRMSHRQTFIDESAIAKIVGRTILVSSNSAGRKQAGRRTAFVKPFRQNFIADSTSVKISDSTSVKLSSPKLSSLIRSSSSFHRRFNFRQTFIADSIAVKLSSPIQPPSNFHRRFNLR